MVTRSGAPGIPSLSRALVAAALAVGVLGASGCTKACTSVGGQSHVNVWTPSLDLAQPISGDAGSAVVVRVCKQGTSECGENPIGAVAGQTDRAPMTSVPLALGADATQLTVELIQGGKTALGPAPITVKPKKWEPNGEGCEPTLYEAAVVADRGQVHEYNP